MAKITVTIEGDVEEVRATFAALLGLTGDADASPPEPAAAADAEAAPTESPWTDAEVATLWNSLTSEAKRILAEIATKPEGYPTADLTDALGLTMTGIGGRLSSVGHNMRRLFMVGDTCTKPWPLNNDVAHRQYTMRPDVAAAIMVLTA